MGFGGEEGSVVLSGMTEAQDGRLNGRELWVLVMSRDMLFMLLTVCWWNSTGSFDATVRLWDCKSQSTKPIQIFEESKDSVSSLHVLGHEVVTGSVDGKMRTYDLRMGMMYCDTLGRRNSTNPLLSIMTFADMTFVCLDPITSVQQTADSNAVLVSTLDSTIRLMDKSNGQMLQNYTGHTNTEFRIRSCLGLGDAVAISGSEDGKICIWDVLEGKVLKTIEAHSGKVASAVTCNNARKEFASAGADGEGCVRVLLNHVIDIDRKCHCLGVDTAGIAGRLKLFFRGTTQPCLKYF